jgi:polysaccharide export outer membrane protein
MAASRGALEMSKEQRSRLLGWKRMGGAMYSLVALVGCTTAASAPPPTPASSEYRIGPGDVLDVMVWREESVSGSVTVRPDGKISVALVGDVQAAGLTPEDLSADLHARLLKFIDNPNVVVRVNSSALRFFVIGNVRSPGTYDLRANQTLLQALAVAGGFTEFANRGGVRIIRQNSGGTPLKVDYDAIVRGDAPDVRLEPNDTLVVP